MDRTRACDGAQPRGVDGADGAKNGLNLSISSRSRDCERKHGSPEPDQRSITFGVKMTRLLVFLIVAAIIGVASRLPAAPAPAKDSLSIDQKDFEIVGWVDKTATRAHAIDLTLNVKYSLVSQLKGYLRAAINLENETSFRSVFATEIGRGDNAQPIKLTIDKPKQKILRVIVWIDRDSPTAAPHPIVSDNIAFDAKVFLNINDR